MKFLFLGTILSRDALAYNLAANPASTKWLSGLVDGVLDNESNEVSLCGHCFSQVWPRGKIFPGKAEFLDQRYSNHLVKFINVPGLRFRSMGRGYYREAAKLLSLSDYDVVITYNAYPWKTYAARRLREKYGLPWICIHLDFDDVGENWATFYEQAGDADGHVFLSAWGYEEAPVELKLHLDAGIDGLVPSFGPREVSETLNLVYLGSLSETNGLALLMQLPRFFPDKNLRFIYGGKAYPSVDQRLKDLASSDPRVEYLGFVDDTQVKSLFERADIFLNPRSPDDVLNDMVFPSKIMHYLQLGKTVVSTWTKGLEGCYRDLLIVSKSGSSDDYMAAISSALDETHADRQERAKKIQTFLEDSRMWSNQGERLKSFARQVIHSRPC